MSVKNLVKLLGLNDTDELDVTTVQFFSNDCSDTEYSANIVFNDILMFQFDHDTSLTLPTSDIIKWKEKSQKFLDIIENDDTELEIDLEEIENYLKNRFSITNERDVLLDLADFCF